MRDIFEELFKPKRPKWFSMDALDLSRKLKGAVLMDCEPIEHPNTSGMILYLRTADGVDMAAEFFPSGNDRLITDAAILPYPTYRE